MKEGAKNERVIIKFYNLGVGFSSFGFLKILSQLRHVAHQN